ncbi:MAG: NUDIX hydrolase [Candidatus Pacebacteria bacterium]|nr:NUDIX hydrolase [Candidatus Paceibacterota bacterium]
MTGKGYATSVLVCTPEGIPLVMDDWRQNQNLWKLPGGRSEAVDNGDPKACGARELEEETGICVMPDILKEISRQDKGSYIKIYYEVHLQKLPKLRERGDEGELIKVFHPAEILKMDNFLPPHRNAVINVIASLS